MPFTRFFLKWGWEWSWWGGGGVVVVVVGVGWELPPLVSFPKT